MAISGNTIHLWDAKFLDCCLAGPVCLLACFCPAVVQSMVLYKRDEGSCFQCMFAFYCCCIGLSINREKIRERKEGKIEGNTCMDCLLYTCVCCCCHACLITQEYRQVSYDESKSRL